MKFGASVVLLLCVSLLSACSQAVSAEDVAASAGVSDAGCETPESGVIKPESPGLPGAPLKGPFLVKSLAVAVDPVNPNNYGSVQWSKEKAWIVVHDFDGSFYLGAEEYLTAEQGKSPWVTVYSGCRLD